MKRRSRSTLTASERAWAVDKYKAGASSFLIANELRTWPTTVMQVLADAGVHVRTFSESQYIRRRREHPFFSILSPAARYWAGFIVADGSLNKVRCCIRIGLARRDREHLVAFLRDLQWTRSVVSDHWSFKNDKRFPSAFVEVTDHRLVGDLIALGVCEAKAGRAPVSRILSESRDFWRGVVDGDGALVLNKRRAVLSLVGTKRLMAQYRQFVQTIVPNCRVKLQRHRTIWAVQLSGRYAELTIRYLYENSDFALARKKDKADRIIARIVGRMTRWLSQANQEAARYDEELHEKVQDACGSGTMQAGG